MNDSATTDTRLADRARTPRRRGPGVMRAALLDDYRMVRRFRGLSIEEAAKAVGISVRTATRYNAELVAAGQQ